MLQPAHTLIQEQNLRIAHKEIESLPDEPLAKTSAFEPIKSDPFNDVAQFYYNGRTRMSFHIADAYKPNFVLLRGLIEFHRPRWAAFQYDKKQHRIDTDISVDQVDQLTTFLSMVTLTLKKEIQFQYALKRAIEFEKRSKLEGDGIYSVLKSFVAATT